MRAAFPDVSGTVDRDGVALAYEVCGDGEPTILLIPTSCLFHFRFWKMQIPYLARRHRVATWDARGNGSSDPPESADAFGWKAHINDLVAVLDATETEAAVMVGVSYSGYWANLAAVLHPKRVLGVAPVAPAAGLGIGHPQRMRYSYTEPLDTTEDWAKENVHFIRSNYREYVEWLVSQIFTEPHSTKAFEDGVGRSLETGAETLIASDTADLAPADAMAAFYRRMDRPALIIHSRDGRIIPFESSRELACLTGAGLVELEGAGHCPNLRDPVQINLAIEGFIRRLAPPPPAPQLWVRGLGRRRRVLCLSSPIGLGHARRDVAIAAELRKVRPEVEIDWLA